MKKLSIAFIASTLLLAQSNAWAEAIIVVAKEPGTVTMAELREIFFQNGGRLSNGQTVIPIDYKEGNPLREQFYQRAFGRSKIQMKAFWAQQIFTGKGTPPLSVETTKDAIEQLRTKSDSYVTYMKESDSDGKLPVLWRIP